MQLLQAVDDAQECVAGVDGSARIADVAKRLVSANKLAADQGGAISVVQGRLEQLDKLPVDKVGLSSTYCCCGPYLQYCWLLDSLLQGMCQEMTLCC